MALNQVYDSFNANNYWGLNAPPEKSKLDMNAFMRLLTVQLSNQNPLEPMNDRDFFAQMAQLGQVQGMDQLEKSMQVSQAAAMMGKTVTAVRPMTESGASDNYLVTGVVTKMVVKNGEQRIVLREANGGEVEVGFNSIQQIEA
ncbi:MAG TPA: flagellar hook capping FlgD N-terminal domain-containing protein [Fimbriimonadaceae bacterium]|nr:flagellar hook capping FlgD N-terminal domain-containing protein [Fimbriimonadaceae bacterium]